MKLETFNLLGVKISVVNLSLAAEFIYNAISSKLKGYVCVAPVSTVIDAQDNQEYCEIINNSLMTTPDGMPVVWCGRLKGHKTIERTYGPELMPYIAKHGQAKGIKHYFYGATPEVCEKLANRLKKDYPNMHIVGSYAPPFNDQVVLESQEVIDQINQVSPDIIWVGLGSPKQDYWMKKHREVFDAPLLIGVGAAFDFLAGVKPQAPQWMRKSGLEWLFRLCSEPKRLWKRYLIGNTRFIFLLIKECFR